MFDLARCVPDDQLTLGITTAVLYMSSAPYCSQNVNEPLAEAESARKRAWPALGDPG